MKVLPYLLFTWILSTTVFSQSEHHPGKLDGLWIAQDTIEIPISEDPGLPLYPVVNPAIFIENSTLFSRYTGNGALFSWDNDQIILYKPSVADSTGMLACARLEVEKLGKDSLELKPIASYDSLANTCFYPERIIFVKSPKLVDHSYSPTVCQRLSGSPGRNYEVCIDLLDSTVRFQSFNGQEIYKEGRLSLRYFNVLRAALGSHPEINTTDAYKFGVISHMPRIDIGWNSPSGFPIALYLRPVNELESMLVAILHILAHQASLSSVSQAPFDEEEKNLLNRLNHWR